MSVTYPNFQHFCPQKGEPFRQGKTEFPIYF